VTEVFAYAGGEVEYDIYLPFEVTRAFVNLRRLLPLIAFVLIAGFSRSCMAEESVRVLQDQILNIA
jgi:hypothetical protein